MPTNRRLQLHRLLTSMVGHVYFQPPETIKLTYPCIVYDLSQIEKRHADNINYLSRRVYELTYITNDPDNTVVDELLELKGCTFDRYFNADNMHHYTFRLYY